ncbi:MAG TPA: AMP-binding protein, partial [Anaerolineae bacterium]|nr:AMP-binding protein [Anaerolineae bacterium]
MTSEVAPWRARISLKEPGRIACVATPGRPLRAIEHARGAGWGLATAAARPHLDPAALRCLLLPFSPCHPAAPLGIMAALLAGGKVILMDHFEPQQALELIEREQVTQFCGTPGMYRRLLQAPAQTRCDLSSLRRATLAGGFCPPAGPGPGITTTI